jgi:hypothetical protein
MCALQYDTLSFKIPIESEDYKQCSTFVLQQIKAIITNAIKTNNNKIIINTNLKLGLPMENINKIAGPFVEAWVVEIFSEALSDRYNSYHLVNVEAGERLNMADVILQFKRTPTINNSSSCITGNIDVKATSQDIASSGKAPNITSFARIRTAYVKDADFIFIILSVKHKVFSEKDAYSGLMNGIMEVVNFNAYDLKYISASDISYNPALGTGQLQIRDIHYVTLEDRTTWEFCKLLDQKCIASRVGFDTWYRYAVQNGWIKNDVEQ